jgi:acyl-coenzyme A synthetase/AMP-(fatty) acid ligase
LFAEPATADALLERVRHHRPTILINVPTMVHKMVEHAEAGEQDLSCLRLATSAGEALPAELDRRWRDTFGVDPLDGSWYRRDVAHLPFESSGPRSARARSARWCRVRGEGVRRRGGVSRRAATGWLWCGDSRAIGYWQDMEKTSRAARGEWYVSGDLVAMDEDGFVTYWAAATSCSRWRCKWPRPGRSRGLSAAAPGGRRGRGGRPARRQWTREADRLRGGAPARGGARGGVEGFVRERPDAYKHPREVVFVDALPRTHLGKVDRGKLRREE